MLELFLMFLKLGLFTFGGGYAMIPLIKENIVEKKKWLTENELIDILAICESTPGPISINLATYIGQKRKGFWGSVLATLGVVIPSFVIIFVISLFLDIFMQNKYVQFAFVGIKCSVAFLIIKTGVEMFIKMEKNLFNIITASVVLVGLIVCDLFAFNLSSIILILLGGVLGICLFGIKRKSPKPQEIETKEDKEQ